MQQGSRSFHCGTDTDHLVRQAERALRRRYRTPALGNKRHVVSELVFIILSARTHSNGYITAYRRLRRRFPSWERVRDAESSELIELLKPAGLARIKVAQIQQALRKISKDFGGFDDRRLKRLSDESLETYLVSLPGVGMKTARCVMMYAADRDVFPVDAHCITLFSKLGLLKARPRMEDAHLLQEMVSPEIRRSLHINAVAHGQQTCKAKAPRCEDCPILNFCIDRRRNLPSAS